MSQLEWGSTNAPISKAYEDIYYDSQNGLEESHEVFIKPNQLEAQFKQEGDFFIGELGFGTGLNFLATWKLWQQTSQSPSSNLYYLSCEKHPLSFEDIQKALSLWNELSPQREKFLSSYKALPNGVFYLPFKEERITLILAVGDAFEELSKLSMKIDAWYFDGFSPAKNPEMWSQKLFNEVSRLSKIGTTFATFASAGWVRRNLETAGFHVQKKQGYGKKREMLQGEKEGEEAPKIPRSKKHAIVIGAGLGGCSLSHALLSKGWKVSLIEKKRDPSAKRLSILVPPLSSKNSPAFELSWKAWLWSSEFFKRNWNQFYFQTGVLQVVADEKKRRRFEKALSLHHFPKAWARHLSSTQATQMAEIPIAHDCIFLEEAGMLRHDALCTALLESNSPCLEKYFGQTATKLEERSDEVIVKDENSNTIAKGDIAILANAYSASDLDITADLPLQKIRGQALMLPPTSSSQKLKTILHSNIYISPEDQGYHLLGASFQPNDHIAEIRESDTSELLDKAAHSFAHLNLHRIPREKIQATVGFRTTTPTKLPLIGALPRSQGRLFCHLAFGSRGWIYAPFLAEELTCQIENHHSLLESTLQKLISPIASH